MVISELKQIKEKLRLQYSDAAKQPLADESSRNLLVPKSTTFMLSTSDSDVDNANVVDLGTNGESVYVMFDYYNCLKEIREKHIAEKILINYNWKILIRISLS